MRAEDASRLNLSFTAPRFAPLKLGGPSQESVTAGLAEARKAEQARVRPSKKVGGDPATVEETGKLMTQKI